MANLVIDTTRLKSVGALFCFLTDCFAASTGSIASLQYVELSPFCDPCFNWRVHACFMVGDDGTFFSSLLKLSYASICHRLLVAILTSVYFLLLPKKRGTKKWCSKFSTVFGKLVKFINFMHYCFIWIKKSVFTYLPYFVPLWLVQPITLALVYVGTTLKDLSDVTHGWNEFSPRRWVRNHFFLFAG